MKNDIPPAAISTHETPLTVFFMAEFMPNNLCPIWLRDSKIVAVPRQPNGFDSSC